jgi:aminocarboxymuconate-semialdehyde decarboxylase
MRKVDVFNRIVPKRFWHEVVARGGDGASLGERLRRAPFLIDFDARFRLMDAIDGYEQVLALAAPPLEDIFAPAVAAELARIANDELHELCERHPARFPGFVATVAMSDPDAAVRGARPSAR